MRWLSLFAAAAAVSALSGNFTRTCYNTQLHRGATGHLNLLTATCLENNRAWTPRNTTLDLNLCLGVSQRNGSLNWSTYGKFSMYCSTCAAVGHTLHCICTTMDGIRANSAIQLNAGIYNDDGVLTCGEEYP